MTFFSSFSRALADCERQCHIEECYNCGQLSQGYDRIGTHLQQTGNLLEHESRDTRQGMVESLKRHRDLLVSLKELLLRRDHARDTGNITEVLKRRVTANEAKLKTLRASAVTAATAATSNNADPAAAAGLYDAQIEKVLHNIHSVN